MKFNDAYAVLDALIHAYYDARDLEATLACVSKDIEWIGTENFDSAHGKAELKKLLEADIDAFPDSFSVEIEPPTVQNIGDNGLMFTIKGKQVAVSGIVGGFSVRGTVCCIKTENGWLVNNVHTSVPNTELEKFNLKKQLNDSQQKEKALMASVPGGLGFYRIKKDGRIICEYASESLAKVCGYEVDEYREYIEKDASVVIVKDDLPNLLSTLWKSAERNEAAHVNYRIYAKSGEIIQSRMDVTFCPKSELQEDDLMAGYAVHTVISEEVLSIMTREKDQEELLGKVPAGIGIYEIDHGVLSQKYMSDAFYEMVGESRESRLQYFGESVLEAVHPDDIDCIHEKLKELVSGVNRGFVNYRVKMANGTWFWLHLNLSVVERKENYTKVLAVFTDYNAVLKLQGETEKAKDTLEIALRSSNTLTWRYDYKNSRVTDSSSFGEKYHYPKIVENVPQRIIDDGLIAKSSEEAFLQLYADIATEKKVSADIQCIEPNGHSIWLRQLYTPTYDHSGNYVDAIGVAIDISEEKRHEQEYKEQIRLYQRATQNALVYASFNLTQNTITSYYTANSEYSKRERFVTADDLFTSVKEDFKTEEEIHKFDEVKDCKTIIDAFKKGTSHIEIITHSTTSLSWRKSVYDIMQNPYSGDIEAVSCIYDVTKSVQGELIASQLIDVDYQSLLLVDVKSGNVLPFITDAEDPIMDEAMDSQESQGNGTLGLEHFLRKYCIPGTADKAIHDNQVDTILEQLKYSPTYECTYSLIQNGKIEHFRILYCYLKGDEQVLLCAVQNITELHKKETQQKEELAQALLEADAANQAKTAFLSRVSHDMRTPLNGILGLTTLMKESITDKDQMEDLLELEVSGKYLLNLINDTLDMSRIESGKLELHPTVCDGRTLFNSALGLSKPNMEAKHIDLHVQTVNIPFTKLYVDIGRLEQVILNVLSNAIKFTPEGGRIDVAMTNLSVENGVITDKLTIQDNGIGISPEFLPHIFDAFSQEDATRTSVYEGTGLGMAITKQLIQLMGGDITVTSELQKGSCFTLILKLPIASEQQVSEWKKSQITTNTGFDFSGKRVLLCEDHPLNAKIATRLLTAKNMLVEHAENGQIAIEMFDKAKPGYYDAILMDIRMPVMDGLKAASEIRSLKRIDAGIIPIIAMTANAFDEDIKQTQLAGMDAHLSKPIQTEVLYSTLANLLQIGYKHSS